MSISLTLSIDDLLYREEKLLKKAAKLSLEGEELDRVGGDFTDFNREMAVLEGRLLEIKKLKKLIEKRL